MYERILDRKSSKPKKKKIQETDSDSSVDEHNKKGKSSEEEDDLLVSLTNRASFDHLEAKITQLQKQLAKAVAENSRLVSDNNAMGKKLGDVIRLNIYMQEKFFEYFRKYILS